MLSQYDGKQSLQKRLALIGQKAPAFKGFLHLMAERGALLVGETVRDCFLSRASKDLDFVVDVDTGELEGLVRATSPVFARTRWGGFRFSLGPYSIDVWPFETTCTLKGLPPKPQRPVSIADYTDLVPFNVDAIAFDLANAIVIDRGMGQAFREGVLRRQFVWHPDPAHVAARARKFIDAYGLRAAPDLWALLEEHKKP
jgi:hypothetical protein